MDLRQLRYFVAIAEFESFTKASISLCVSQSALSRQGALLENEIGVSLFERSGKRVSLSRNGKLFRRAATRLLSEAQKLKSMFRDVPGAGRRRITVGAPQTLGHVLFPRLKRRLAASAPNIALTFVEGLADQLDAALTSGTIDIAASAFIRESENVAAHVIVREPIYLVGAVGTVRNHAASCAPAAAFAHPLILPVRGSRERMHWEEVAGNLGLRIRAAAEVDNVDLAKIMMRDGDGHMLLPAPAVREFAQDPAIAVTAVRKLSVARIIAVRRDRDMDAAIAIVKSLIVDEVEALAQP